MTIHPSTLSRRLVVAARWLVLAGQAILSACSTTEGFGKDVKKLGGGIESGAAGSK